jgi:ABC-type molybdate transport system substrate-binding protein
MSRLAPSSTRRSACAKRIEAGERLDAFTSADLGHAPKLVQDGRATAMAMLAQSTLRLLVPAPDR